MKEDKKTNSISNWTCPLPKQDYDHIILGHGSGGSLTQKLLDGGVFSLFDNPWLNEQEDGAVVQMRGDIAISTDSFVVSPIFFPGGNIGDLAVHGTVNDIAMCGAVPKFLTLSFILEEGLPMEEFQKVLMTIKEAADNADVDIVTGDTKVVEKGKGDKIFINTTGIGFMHPRAALHYKNVKPGDAIIVSGYIARHGIAVLSVREGLEFEAPVLSDTAALNHMVLDIIEDFGDDIRFLRDPTRGGIASTTNELAQKTRLGVALDQASLPVDDVVEGACEMLGLDPLYVANEGIFVAVVDQENADAIVHRLKSHVLGKDAKIIGHITEEHPGQVICKSLIGGRRVVQMLPGEQLPRIC